MKKDIEGRAAVPRVEARALAIHLTPKCFARYRGGARRCTFVKLLGCSSDDTSNGSHAEPTQATATTASSTRAMAAHGRPAERRS